MSPSSADEDPHSGFDRTLTCNSPTTVMDRQGTRKCFLMNKIAVKKEKKLILHRSSFGEIWYGLTPSVGPVGAAFEAARDVLGRRVHGHRQAGRRRRRSRVGRRGHHGHVDAVIFNYSAADRVQGRGLSLDARGAAHRTLAVLELSLSVLAGLELRTFSLEHSHVGLCHKTWLVMQVLFLDLVDKVTLIAGWGAKPGGVPTFPYY
jgi:hypothetical protein